MNWPRVQPLPYREDAASYFALLRDLPWPVWLDSGHPGAAGGRFDVIAADPLERVQLDAAEAGQVADTLRHLLGPYLPCPAGVPFCGGLIGYASYELGRAWMGLAGRRGTPLAPDLCAGLYDWALVVDHRRRQALLVGAGRASRTRLVWNDLCARLAQGGTQPPLADQPPGQLLEQGFDRAAYARTFAEVQRYIRDGDAYQVNLTRRFLAAADTDAWSAYRRLRAFSPAPFGAFMDFGAFQVLSNSPEQFLQFDGAQVRTRPIKGTRPRGQGALQDARLRDELAHSAKDRAENLMIVDLLRNDLGRVAQTGSVQVPQLFGIESYATVHHLVSTVTGRLARGHDAIDLLLACFPGGSITGAPKRRAMEIIDELEPHGRELYCGSLFQLGLDGRLNSNISIRTLLGRDRHFYYWSGGGIVADSECGAEYQETLDKAAAFFRLFGLSPPL